MIGARLATDTPLLAPLRRLIARATARDLRALVVPGRDVALAAGLDLHAAGLEQAESPRQANVLVVVGALPAGMADAASVAYAQMPRPRAVLALGAGEIAPLPAADVAGDLSQAALEQAVRDLRGFLATGAFASEIVDFDAPALQSRIEYTCPMHPEVVSDTPGDCPKCGMFLVPRETSAGAGAGGDGDGGHDHGSTAAMPATATTHAHTTGPAHDHEATRYTCPMHPEVVSDVPGDCPKCGMTLVPAEQDGHQHGHDTHHGEAAPEATRYTCPMHPEVVSDGPGDCPKCGMTLVPAEQDGHQHGHDTHHGEAAPEAARYTCPMHPEVVSDTPGNCPKCGMNLVPVEQDGHGGHVHPQSAEAGVGWLERIEPGFMSMIEMTEGTPRSSDGLQMEWITTPFGPFFPGLPGGLTLALVLDGDTVAEARAGSLATPDDPLRDGPLAAAEYVDALAGRMPLAPVCYRLLACRAIEAAAGIAVKETLGQSREAAVQRERIVSHLFWLAQTGRQLGMTRLSRRAAALGLSLRAADKDEIATRAPATRRLIARWRAVPFLTRRLAATGDLPADAQWRGPTGADATAAGRLAARLADIEAGLAAIAAAPGLALAEPPRPDAATGKGDANVETPRGRAGLHVELRAGKVVAARLDTPSAHHLGLVGALAEGRELADALVAVGSLDLDPWEIGA